ncbi:imidazole glycerol phosphate synthase subunit HisH [Terricaulis sp.]|uniref:imidazole glycerol phosphate synthase subunit HisH n=1 Tax=Terricaulis sp. TaxID=2768686 RepID=UPI002AC3CBA6|nr:imidazole glycerol phosphate synthase subunit HisH [Terricaulis sp.]MDZ4690369.1 imidazole glycerol phosphate synthase subunit HisH [Terricaulis sp.]
MSVAVIKLGVGNTASVMFALERLGAAAELTDDAARIAEAERVILPGVGAAAAAMQLLDSGLRQVLRKFPRPLLGICLGQQLLYDFSQEGDVAGLGLLAGDVTVLERTPRLPIPHMGWSALQVQRETALFEGVTSGEYAYFVHSYACPVDDATVATADYGRPFSAAVARGNVFGCQFHPERSGAVGARVLSNFLALPC